MASGSLTYATALGSEAIVSTSNTIVLGRNYGQDQVVMPGNVGIGTNAPAFKLQVIDTSNTGLRVQTNAAGGTVASFGGSGVFQIDASGVNGGRFHISENGNVGVGTNAPNEKLEVNGVLRVNQLGSIGGTQLCRNLFNQISNCSSSLRYKNNIASFSPDCHSSTSSGRSLSIGKAAAAGMSASVPKTWQTSIHCLLYTTKKARSKA